MTKRTYQILSVLLLSLLLGCEDKEFAVSDLQGSPPFVGSVSLSPDSTNIDTQIPLDGMYTVTTVVGAGVTDPEGSNNLATVVANVIRPNSSTSILTVDLHDDGVSPDLIANDGLYSASIQYRVTRPQAGRYRIQISATDKSRLRSNLADRSFFVARNNARPGLFGLIAPDTVTIPVGGALLVHMTISASDSDGIADVREVFFRSLTSTNPDFRFFLKDDGGTDPISPPFFQTSGDSVAGDGRYSVLIPLNDGPNVRRTNIFAFQAFDSFGDSSGTPLIHQLVVR